MGTWQWVIVVMWGLRLLCGLVLDGKERLDRNGEPQKYCFSVDLAGVAIGFIILYFGGFFK